MNNSHLFNYEWYLKDGYPSKNIKPNNLNVFGTFICGGGSTMGYKLAGFNHLGGVEIDKKVADVYEANHKSKYLYNEDIRLFNKRNDLPSELYNLDILDGSPPCSTFSMAGSRDKAWGKEKQFREGQAMQTLDDLVFVYCNTIGKLKPKVAILENVKGIIQGNAKAYSIEIKKKIESFGYKVQIFLLNASTMGVPQKRERVFFIALRNDFDLPKLELKFNEKLITFGEIKHYDRKPINNGKDSKLKTLWLNKKDNEDFAEIQQRLFNKNANFTTHLVYDEDVFRTITSSGHYYYHKNCSIIADKEYCQIGSYPLDYNFKGIEPKYLIGMSVPPIMTAQIANQIYLQWLSKLTN
jgi:DNA (cytosine-5)-methyltransferase 1